MLTQMELARLRAELTKTKIELNVVKKSRSVLRDAIHLKYAFIYRQRGIWPVSMLCEHLEVSPSGHLQHPQRRAVNQRKLGGRISNDAVLAHIKAIHAQVKGKYSWPRVTQQLVVDALRMAWFRRRLAAGLAVH